MTSKPDYDSNPLEDLPPPSYEQATATDASLPNSSNDPRRSAEDPQNGARSIDSRPNMAVSAAQASLAGKQNRRSSMTDSTTPRDLQDGPKPYGDPRLQRPRSYGDPEFQGPRSYGDLRSEGPGFMPQPQRGGPMGYGYDYNPGGMYMGDRAGMAGPYPSYGPYGPNQMYGPSMNRWNDFARGPLNAGFLGRGRGGGLLGHGRDPYAGGMGSHRERKAERKCARREARWERRGF